MTEPTEEEKKLIEAQDSKDVPDVMPIKEVKE